MVGKKLYGIEEDIQFLNSINVNDFDKNDYEYLLNLVFLPKSHKKGFFRVFLNKVLYLSKNIIRDVLHVILVAQQSINLTTNNQISELHSKINDLENKIKRLERR